MKKTGIVLLVLCILLSNFAPVLAAGNTAINVTVDGKELKFDVPPTMIAGRTLVPMRAIFEALGASVEWDGGSRTVTGKKGDVVIKLPLDSIEATKNNNTIHLDVPATMIQGRTLVPVRFIAESLGAKVEWNAQSSTVVILSSKDQNTTTQNRQTQKFTTNQIAEKGNAVVTIVNTSSYTEDLGSGFLISKDGKIVTNYHVIAGAESLEVVFHDDTTYRGEVRVLGYDVDRDIAILKINGNNYPYLELGKVSTEKIGNDIVVIGSPLGYKNTVSTGIISGFRDGFVQITAPISPGSSGGPVLNYYGEVIGIIVSAYLTGGNLGFAIPIGEIDKIDTSKNLTLVEVKELEYEDIDFDYELYTAYLYATASSMSINNHLYSMDFFEIHIYEHPENPEHVILYYVLDTINAMEFFDAYNDGYRDNIRDLFGEIVFELEEFYEKSVTGVIVYYDNDWDIYPHAFVENNITNMATVEYNSITRKWSVFYPLLEIDSIYGEDNYTFQWFHE